MSRLIALVFAAAALLCVAASPARAADFEFGMEDEGLMLGDPASAPPEAAKWKQLGVDIVRIHADWWLLAPGLDDDNMPSRFKPDDPNDPLYHWFYLDAAIGIAHAAGLKVMLTVTGPGPLWSSSDPSRFSRCSIAAGESVSALSADASDMPPRTAMEPVRSRKRDSVM